MNEAPAWPVIPQSLELNSHVVHVIRLRLDLPSEKWMSLSRFLTDAERSRAAQFRFESPRQQFVVCRATLRRLLGQQCKLPPDAVPLGIGRHGKPELLIPHRTSNQQPQIEFNVSHSGKIGLIAMTIGAPVGIDVEEYDSRVQTLKLAERFFSPEEANALSSLSDDKQLSGFYRGWTCKEAYIKAKGSGLSLSLSSFRVEIDPDRPAALCHIEENPSDCANWTAQSLEVGKHYAAAVMIERPRCLFECWDWPDE